MMAVRYLCCYDLQFSIDIMRLNMFDDDFDNIDYRYFNSGAILEPYADKHADLVQSYVMWNHGIGEMLNSLIKNGLEILSFDELDYSPYSCFKKTVEYEPNRFRIAHLEDKIPMG
jgi:hypothetical protein